MTYALDENRQKVFLDRYALKSGNGEPIETDVERMWQRVATSIAAVEETSDKRTEYTDKFYDLLYDFKFVPGGRILAGAGQGARVTMYNCFVLPSPDDSYDGIFESVHQMGSIQRRGGGTGLDLSSLRPKGAYVAGTGGFSSGPVAFAGIYSETTNGTSQGGSRRGALMLMLKDSHPDIFEFVTEKQKPGRITGANVSVKAGDDFMQAVKDDADWNLEWGGKVYKTVKARELFDMMVDSAWKSAEPGLYFYQRANKLSNLYYIPEMELIATNPLTDRRI